MKKSESPCRILAILAWTSALACASVKAESPIALPFENADSQGVPPGWKRIINEGEATSKVVALDGRTSLTVDTRKGHARFEHDVSIASPEHLTLSWDWRVHHMPETPQYGPWNEKGRVGEYQTNSPVQMLIIFRQGFKVYVIHYLWEPTVEVGYFWPQEETAGPLGIVKLHYQRLVVRSGPAEMDEWHSEARDVVADFKKLFRGVKKIPDVIRIAIQCNSTFADGEGGVSSASVANIVVTP